LSQVLAFYGFQNGKNKLPTTLQPWLYEPWRKAAKMGTAHSWHPKGYIKQV